MLERVYSVLNADPVRQLTLLLLRVSVGMLAVWWGLSKILMDGFGSTISDTFYDGSFSYAWLQLGFGGLQTLLGGLVVLGLFREIVYLAQLAVHGFTAAAVWYALVDPFGWWLELERPFPHTQLFYPSAIIVAACLLLIAFRNQEAWALDRLFGRHRPRRPAGGAEVATAQPDTAAAEGAEPTDAADDAGPGPRTQSSSWG
jgi:uncharacterized membrane protein YphA (DoxX/SURF4 family)